VEALNITEVMLAARVMIVDDTPANVKVLERMLKKEGFSNLCSITDSREVEAQFLEKTPDLILLDIRMPHLDGFQVMELVNRIKGNSPVSILVLTAQIDLETRYKALSAGANDFLTKPFEMVEVLLRVRNMLETQLLHKESVNSNDILTERVRQRTKELEDTVNEIVVRLGRAAEFRDNETGLHVVRMSKYSFEIGRVLGYDEIKAYELMQAAGMHDIGKIGTPDNVLLKPDKLDENEWRMMKLHTLIGAEILSGSRYPLLQMAERIALSHHEKWDGSGYPKGLKGEEIPIEARIIPVADVFDALTSKRPYKKAWPVEDAVNEIKNSKGTHFDPVVVDAFLQCLPKILEIKEEFSEPEVALTPGGT